MRIRRVCSKYPARVAVEFGSKKITYSSLIEKIDEAAVAWKKLGVQTGDKVMLMMGHNPMNLISIYALDKLGAAAALCVPNIATEYFVLYANIVGAEYCVMSCNQYWNYSSELQNTKIKTVVIGKYSSMMSGIDGFSFYFNTLRSYDKPKPRFFPKGIRVMDWQEVLELPEVESDPQSVRYNRDVERPAVYLFPSEADLESRVLPLNAKRINLSANLTQMIYMANEDVTGNPARFLCLNESCFPFGLVVGILGVLASGQTALLFTWFDPDRIFYAIKRYKPDVLIGYNSTVAMINKAGARSDVLRSVDRIVVGGGLLTSTQKAMLFEIAQYSRKNILLCSVTGCDELLTYAYGPSDLESDRLLGFPIPGVIMKIADSETGLDVPEGTEGEIAVCSPLFTRADLEKSGGRKKRFRLLPDGRVWFFTGKIGKLDENKMFYLVGSKSREARIDSYPVYLDMVDEAVQMSEGVVESCSVVIESPEGPVLVSAVVPEEKYFYDNSLIEDLRDRIRSECELMLHEAMRPSETTFFVSLPKDSKGMVDYEAVKEKVSLILDENGSTDVIVDQPLA